MVDWSAENGGCLPHILPLSHPGYSIQQGFREVAMSMETMNNPEYQRLVAEDIAEGHFQT